MTPWSDLFPYVLPYVIGCPDPTAEQHIKLAAIDFCRRTLCHRVTVEPELCSGVSHDIELYPEQGTQIIKIKAVAVGKREFSLVDPVKGLSLARSEYPSDFVFTQDNLTLQVYPLQVSGTPVVTDVALAPAITATGLSSMLAAAHLQDIVQGAIASIKRVPGQPFSDLNGSTLHQGLFEARIKTVAAKVARGFASVRISSHGRFF
jgi:hypothetical protein